MTDRESLLALVLDDPADDTARLVLADWLRESGDSDAQARGRFLWAGVTVSQFRDEPVIEDRLYYTPGVEHPPGGARRVAHTQARCSPDGLSRG